MNRPLSGLRIMVTRAKSQAASLSDRLIQLGATVIEAPMIDFAEPLSYARLDHAIAGLSDYDWLLFASANAVDSFFGRLAKFTQLDEKSPESDSISSLRPGIAVIGPGTAKAVIKHGYQVNFSPGNFVAESFVEEFIQKYSVEGMNILWPKTDIGRKLIADELQACGANVEIVTAYRTLAPENSKILLKELLARGNGVLDIDIITLASSQTAKNLACLLLELFEGDTDMNDRQKLSNLLSGALIASIGPITTATANKCLKDVAIEAKTHSLDGMIDSILDWQSNKHRKPHQP